MEVYDCIRSRLSVREFKPDPVPDGAVRRMLNAARWAPSARNRQPWSFIVIRHRDTLAQISGIASSGGFIGGAPLAVAVVMAPAGRPEFDAGRALQQLELAAWAQGIGGCVAGIRGEENDRVKELLHIPPDQQLITVMALGYPTEAAAAGTKSRKPLPQIAYGEKYGEPLAAG